MTKLSKSAKSAQLRLAVLFLAAGQGSRLGGFPKALLKKNGVTLLIDPMSYQYLVGAEIDYTEGLQGSQFVIRNPNATSTCGCGSSFSV